MSASEVIRDPCGCVHDKGQTVLFCAHDHKLLLDKFARVEVLRAKLDWLQEKEPYGFAANLLVQAQIGCMTLHDKGRCRDCDTWRALRAERADLQQALKEAEEAK